MAFSWMSHSGMSFSVGTSLFCVLGRLKAGTVHGPGTCGMLRCGWETPQADRSRAPPPQGRPILRCLSWRARQLAGLQGRKPWEATLAGASLRALLNLAFAGGPTRSIIPRWGPGAGEEQWRRRAGLAQPAARQEAGPRAPGQEAGQQCTAHLHTPPLHF